MMFLYELFKNYGLAVIIFALVVKLIMLPFQAKSKRSMMKTSRLQPKMNELQKKHGANKQKYNEEVQKLYKEEKINPMSGCLWSLIPFPIIIALFAAIRDPLTMMMGVAKDLVAPGGAIYNLYASLIGSAFNPKDGYLQIKMAEFISQPKNYEQFHQLSANLRQIDYNFLGMKLGEQPDFKIWTFDWNSPDILSTILLFLLPIVSGVLAYFSSQISMKMNPAQSNAQQQQSTKMMMLMMPLISVYFGFIMPGAIGIYMIAQTVFSMIQDIWLTKRYTKILDAEDAVKIEQQRIKEAELEAKRLETERKKLENKTEVNPNTSKKKQQKAERQEQLDKTVEWEKKHTPAESKDEDPSRVDTRRYARGRAYNPGRFAGVIGEDADSRPAEAEEEASSEEHAVYDPENSSITFESEKEQDEDQDQE
jgi:YidC/Oxa1 family membrane protein insertase